MSAEIGLSGIETGSLGGAADLSCAGKYLKPYQGLKPFKIGSRKAWLNKHGGKYLKPYQGLKHADSGGDQRAIKAGKYLKPYQGLKRPHFRSEPVGRCRKIPKTLSGIETERT